MEGGVVRGDSDLWRLSVRKWQRPEPVPPHPHRLVADVDPAFEQQVLHVPQAQGVLHVHHHQADHLGR